MLCHSFLQLRNLCLLLLDNTSQVFDAVVVWQLVFGHLKPARVRDIRSQIWGQNISYQTAKKPHNSNPGDVGVCLAGQGHDIDSK